MFPYFVDPSWFERHWYGSPPAHPSKPHPVIGWVALAGSFAVGVIVLATKGA